MNLIFHKIHVEFTLSICHIENDRKQPESQRKEVLMAATNKNKHMTEIIRYTDINDMLKNIKRCGAILGIRFHSTILAIRMGIPVVPIAYSDKTKNALDEIGYSGKIYDVNNIDTDEVLKSILNAVPYKLDGNIIKSAENHIKRFDEYIKRQC